MTAAAPSLEPGRVYRTRGRGVWSGAAAGRVLSLAVDGRPTARNGQAVAFELFIGLAHVAAMLGPSG
jgi:hypothetical protein